MFNIDTDRDEWKSFKKPATLTSTNVRAVPIIPFDTKDKSRILVGLSGFFVLCERAIF